MGGAAGPVDRVVRYPREVECHTHGTLEAAAVAVEERVKAGLRSLGIVATMNASRQGEGIFIHLSLGRVIDRLAGAYEKVYLAVPVDDGESDVAQDYRLQATHVELIPQPAYHSTFGSFRHFLGIVRSYARLCRRVDAVFVRGMVPLAGVLYLLAFVHRLKPSFWIIGNPIALMRSHRRASRLKAMLYIAYAWQLRLGCRLGRWLTGGAFVCNGRELGELFRSPRTVVAVSSTVTEEEFHERADTCADDVVRILFIGFIRPEKGLEYLIEAVGKLRLDRPWELRLVGPCEKYAGYRQKLEGRIDELGLGARIRWEGYVSYGEPMFRYLRGSDVFVLPTLSEGTPRVLVEARANSLPLVASAVGGIPTSVTDGVDGLLVPAKDADALAEAITRIVTDGKLRRALIRNGLQSARRLTVDRFVEVALDTLQDQSKGEAP
jgi:glycosyltransferase involved in cell wall biosynthesis